MLTKCICTNCAGHLEFEEENAGEKIKCPHCGFDTTLFLPGDEPDEEFAPSRPRFLRSKTPVILAAAALLILAGIGYSLKHWVLPPLKDWLPLTDSAVLPVLVLGVGCLAVLFVLAWTVFPILAYFQLRQMTEALRGVQSALRPVLPAEPIIEEDVTEELSLKGDPDLEDDEPHEVIKRQTETPAS
jgi:hypothetical protein